MAIEDRRRTRRFDATERAEIIKQARDNVARHRKQKTSPAWQQENGFHQDTPPDVLTCDHD
ncbi:hypothetical protein SSBR45G_02740 [Bradyrhizobium sp. SSBR45G]|nr:hypothetical protein SSBR45G_02740 [Bradyrhizobium sp. SSBR45G]GLH82847.1 hypothetical protein SSBR45R_03070 [Bradyrhizobium sp. SSBR45R]